MREFDDVDQQELIDNYGEDSFDIQEGLDGIRHNASMYIGSSGKDGINKLLLELTDNAKDESDVLIGVRVLHIYVKIDPDGVVTVKDNGRGIPVGVNTKHNKRACYIAFENLHGGAKGKHKEKQDVYVGSSGVHGLGNKAVNAFSKFVEVEIRRDGKIYSFGYRNGGRERIDLKEIGETSETGTQVKFLYDDSVLKTGVDVFPYDIDNLLDRFKDYVIFNDNVEITFEYDTGELTQEEQEELEALIEATGDSEIFHPNGRGRKGIVNFTKDSYSLDNIIEEYSVDSKVYYIEEKNELYSAKVWFSFVGNYEETIKWSIVNGMRMVLGSAQQYVFQEEVVNYFKSVYRASRKLKEGYNLTDDSILNKFNYIISIKTDLRDFGEQAKLSFKNDEIKERMRLLFKRALEELEPSTISKMVNDIEYEYKEKIKAHERHLKEKEAKLPNHNKRESQEASLMLKDCRNGRNLKHKNRLWMVEGESAANSFGYNRDINRDGYVPFMGKLLNVMKNNINRKSRDGRNRISTKPYKYLLLMKYIIRELDKYGTYYILTDADVDGKHIRNLMMFLIFKFFPDVIDKGMLRIAEAPLYRVVKGKEERYAYDDTELHELESQGFKLEKRFKGLGEMRKGELYDLLVSDEARFIIVNASMVESIYGELFSEFFPDEEEERFSDHEKTEMILEMIAGKSLKVRKMMALELMNDKCKDYYKNSSSYKRAYMSKINPIHLSDDGVPLSQENLDEMFMDEYGEYFDEDVS